MISRADRTRKERKRVVVIVALCSLVAIPLGAVSCSGYNDARGKGDAPVGPADDSAAEIINFPDGFSGVATKCDGHGHRLYVVTHDKSDVPVTVIADPSCPGGAAR